MKSKLNVLATARTVCQSMSMKIGGRLRTIRCHTATPFSGYGLLVAKAVDVAGAATDGMVVDTFGCV